MLNDRFGGQLGSGWQNVPQVGVFEVSGGAALLEVSDPVLTETQRQKNRRISFALTQFVP
jgi:hypothetical protein